MHRPSRAEEHSSDILIRPIPILRMARETTLPSWRHLRNREGNSANRNRSLNLLTKLSEQPGCCRDGLRIEWTRFQRHTLSQSGGKNAERGESRVWLIVSRHQIPR